MSILLLEPEIPTGAKRILRKGLILLVLMELVEKAKRHNICVIVGGTNLSLEHRLL